MKTINDQTDFIFDIIAIKRSNKTDAQKHADIMQLIIDKPENLHYAASVINICIIEDYFMENFNLH